VEVELAAQVANAPLHVVASIALAVWVRLRRFEPDAVVFDAQAHSVVGDVEFDIAKNVQSENCHAPGKALGEGSA
jgi:hypothetical protein